MRTSLPLLRLTAVCILLLGAGGAHAQYSWIDEKGVRQFSDRPPPPSTPPHKILKASGRVNAAPLPPPAPAPAKEPRTLAEREADYRERAKQREEQDKKSAEEAERRRLLAERCQSAREVQAQAESGIRIARVDANGERRYMTDQERAEQLARARRMLAECR